MKYEEQLELDVVSHLKSIRQEILLSDGQPVSENPIAYVRVGGKGPWQPYVRGELGPLPR